MDNKDSKLGLFALIALVIGSMIGGGAFNLATDMASGAHAGAILIAWVITAIGIITLGLSFQNLSDSRPDLDGGVFSYAKAGFGNYLGFNSAWGYWVSAFLGNVSYGALLFSSIGYFLSIFDNDHKVAQIIGASVILWLVHALVLRGVKSAAMLNAITTVAKLIPIALFIVACIFAFKIDIFTVDFWGTETFDWNNVVEQVKSTMLVTLWVFIGVEGAVVLSGRARKRSDVGKATIIGLLATIVIYLFITLLSLGVMNQQKLAGLDAPSMAYVLEHVVGKWGAVVVNGGLVISVLGAWLGWTLLAAEIPYIAAKDKVFPRFFAKENKNGAPIGSLLITNICIQVFLLTFLVSDKPYNFAFSLASSAILIPYLFSAFYQVKHTFQNKKDGYIKNMVVGIVASIYAIWLVYAGGLDYLLLTILLYTPGIAVFAWAQKENKQKAFKTYEAVVAVIFVLIGLYAVYQLITGNIEIF